LDSPRNNDQELLFKLDVLAFQMENDRKMALYTSFLSIGASFEVFSLTLFITGLLLEKGLPLYWTILSLVYLISGVFFITFGATGFHKLRNTENVVLKDLKTKLANRIVQSQSRSERQKVN
jgi:hypothetical protein